MVFLVINANIGNLSEMSTTHMPALVCKSWTVVNMLSIIVTGSVVILVGLFIKGKIPCVNKVPRTFLLQSEQFVSVS